MTNIRLNAALIVTMILCILSLLGCAETTNESYTDSTESEENAAIETGFSSPDEICLILNGVNDINAAILAGERGVAVTTAESFYESFWDLMNPELLDLQAVEEGYASADAYIEDWISRYLSNVDYFGEDYMAFFYEDIYPRTYQGVEREVYHEEVEDYFAELFADEDFVAEDSSLNDLLADVDEINNSIAALGSDLEVTNASKIIGLVTTTASSSDNWYGLSAGESQTDPMPAVTTPILEITNRVSAGESSYDATFNTSFYTAVEIDGRWYLWLDTGSNSLSEILPLELQ